MSSRRLIALSSLLCFAPFCTSAMKILSPSFSNGQPLPRECGYHYANRNPELLFSEVPARARSLALIMDDPDAPSGTFVHWVVWNLPPATAKLLPGKLPPEACKGRNQFGDDGYDGPAPPSGVHRYFFRLFALDTLLTLPTGTGRKELEKAMAGHVVDEAALMGTYSSHR